MGWDGALLLALGLVVAFVNTVATRRLWASPIFERPQKVAQTILVWLVPGSVIVVWGVLRESRPGQQADPTTGAIAAVDWVLGSWANHQHHHGGDGGHHAGGDGGGHHGGFGGDGGHGGGGGHDGGAGGSDGGASW